MLTITINRSNALQVEEGNTVVTEATYTPGEDITFKYSTRTFASLTCVSEAGTFSGSGGKLVHPTTSGSEGYTLDISAVPQAAGPAPSNVKFPLKKKSTGLREPKPKF